MDEIEITPLAAPFAASIRVPGSKSITNRALLIAAMADGRSTIEGVLFSDDTHRMTRRAGQLGFASRSMSRAARIIVTGRWDDSGRTAPTYSIGGAGTAMRFLSRLRDARRTAASASTATSGCASVRSGALLDAMHRARRARHQ